MKVLTVRKEIYKGELRGKEGLRTYIRSYIPQEGGWTKLYWTQDKEEAAVLSKNEIDEVIKIMKQNNSLLALWEIKVEE